MTPTKEQTMTPEQWIIHGKTGTSSMTIWAVLMGVATATPGSTTRYDVPYDPDDFSRCHELLELIPEWRARLHEVADVFPEWGPLVAHWDELSELYTSRQRTVQYQMMQRLIDEGREAAGWERVGSSGWKSPSGSTTVELSPGVTLESQ